MKPFRWKIASLVALMLGTGSAGAAEPKLIQASLQPMKDRKQAPAFVLEAASGKKVSLAVYRGKVVLLDFWATECGGCIKELPGFMELAQAYKNKDFAVVGVSMDILYEGLKNAEEAWGRVNPFVQTHKVNYPILMGDDLVTKSFDIKAMPVTYLIDKSGRIAASYVGVVDQANVEANIRIMLRESGH
jgi:peroxiredoxin